ncbi:MAG: type 3 dihydrofolate reductase [Anaerolineae bacterium]
MMNDSPAKSRRSIIVAMNRNRVIGRDGRLPWRLPDDMAWFKRQTMGKPVLMGRKTYESIPAKFRPLPGRHNIVLTRQPDYRADGVTVVHTVAAALAAAGAVDEVIIGGGAELYRLFLPQTDKIYLTLVDAEVDGDTFFPELDEQAWQETFDEYHPADGRHPFPFTWRILERR